MEEKEETANEAPHSRKIISWSALEYPLIKRHPDWYWSVGFVALAIIILSILLHNLLFALLVFVGTFALLLHAVRSPHMVTFSLTPSEIKIENDKFPYGTLHSFWVDTKDEEDRKLIIQTKKLLSIYLILPVAENIDEHELRDYLLSNLPEEEHHEPLPQKIMERLGF